MSKIEFVAASVQTKADMPPTRPFIIYPGTDISGTATGNPGVESYCALDTTENSRYRLNRDDHNQIFQFFLTSQGSTRMAYCLDKFADGPYGDIPYQSTSFESLFPTATARQKKMLAWIMANAFPTVTADQTFSLVGVDSQESPVLDDNDAYAAVQVALWVLLGQIAPSEVEFLDCGSDAEHPKSQRMRAAVLRLLEMAGRFADEASSAPSVSLSANSFGSRNCCTQDFLQCCNKGVIPGDPSIPYVVFHGCPDEVRTICGRLLIGPFCLQSSFTGTPSITVEPLCSCENGFSASFADFCGNAVSSPKIGDEFYLVVRAVRKFMCFQINVSVTGNVTRVVTMEPNAQNYQPIGATFENTNTTVTTSICLCVAVPEPSAGTSHSCQSISINNSSQSNNSNNSTNNNNNNNTNNNNNNNNDNNSSNNNNNANNGGFPGFGCIPCFNCMPIYPPQWPYPPIPPYPPTPPYPPVSPCRPGQPCLPIRPCCPEPPYPSIPPCYPEPPCLPIPPCPPKPPCCPEPSCPPKPPCCPEPPCPPKPPCCPEPPCPPKPPCCPEPPCPPMPPCCPEPPCPPMPPCPPEPPCPPKQCFPCLPKLPCPCCKHQ